MTSMEVRQIELDRMNAVPHIVDEKDMTPGMARYWKCLQRKLTGKVDLIDPWRRSLKKLRAYYGSTFNTVYRASTGGYWGKSSEITTL